MRDTGRGRPLPSGFEASLGFRASVNLYHTPSDAQAFALHYDWNDVFVLQLEGSKTWRVFDPVIELPRSDETRLPELAVRAEDGRELRMEAGDLLYIPRGWPHMAVNDGEGGGVSTHLTVVSIAGWRLGSAFA